MTRYERKVNKHEQINEKTLSNNKHKHGKEKKIPPKIVRIETKEKKRIKTGQKEWINKIKEGKK